MREPRPTQRFPRNGQELYEALRRDAEPIIVWILSEEDERETAVLQEYTLLWHRFFDPMLYFWPVERQHVVAIFWLEVDEDLVKRLVRALQRDGAAVVSVSQPTKMPPRDAIWSREDLRGRRWDHYGDVAEFIKSRTETVDALGLPGRDSREG